MADTAAEDVQYPVQHVVLHGDRVAYRRTGSGPVLLLLHGIAGSSSTWTAVMRLLESRFTLIAPDFLGHGESDKPDGDYSLGNHASAMRDLLHVLDVDRVTVVGQSFGGGVALQFSYQYPELCERLVLVDAGGLGREVSWMLRLLAVPGVELVLPLLFPHVAADVGDSVVRFVRDRGVRNPRVAEMWRSYRSLTDPAYRRAFLRTMRSVVDAGGQSVSAIDRLYLAGGLPILVVWGADDRIIPVSHAYRAQEALPHSRLVVFPDVGHFPHAEAPERFVDALVDFIDSTEPASLSREDLGRVLRERAGPHGIPEAPAD
jgi:pimeloyl-ACP methyl ester carboxylesterase